MENARNLHSFALDPVENAMAFVDDTANAVPVVWPRFTNQRKVFQLGEDHVDGVLVGIGCIVSEPFGAVFVNLDQVSTSVLAQQDFRHAGRGDWR